MPYEKFHDTHCPACDADLTQPQAIVVEFTDGTKTLNNVRSQVSAEGLLDDPTGQIGIGQHAGSYCAACGELLDELESEDLLPVLQPVIITTSLEGDWVRVTQGDERLIDNHAISPDDLKACLEQLGFEVHKEERPADEF